MYVKLPFSMTEMDSYSDDLPVGNLLYYTDEQVLQFNKSVQELALSEEVKQTAREKLAEALEEKQRIIELKRSLKESIAHLDDTPDNQFLSSVVKDIFAGYEYIFRFENKDEYDKNGKLKIRKITILGLEEDNRREIRKWERLLHLGEKPKQYANSFDLETIKQIPITELYAFDRLQLRQTRSQAFCPFHAGHSASFTIYHEDNHFHCFGCGEHGDNIKFIMKIHSMTFKEAGQYLCNAPTN